MATDPQRGNMTLLKHIALIDNGAQFINVDLHIHTYGGSHDVTDTTMTSAAVVDSAVRQGLGVIGITDHNSYLNVQAAIDRADTEHGRAVLVIPGVEVTTAHGHLLAYFPPENVAALTKFLSRLDLSGEMGAEDTHTAKSMSDVIAEADRLGGICVAAHIDRERTGFDAFAPGFQNWKKDILTSPGLYGLECDSDDALTWYSDQDEGSAGAERGKLLAARRSVDSLSSRRDLAHLRGSDAHSMARFEHKDPAKPWTRMKLAELSFGAVRVALVDPTARVVARSILPEAVPRVVGVSFTGGFLHEEKIHFSRNLNCFIGGRGTGKSTAIRAIAYALGANDDFADYDNCPDAIQVWCEDTNGVLYRYERTRNGSIVIKAKEDGSITDVPIDSFQIEYFGQGELAKVAEDPLNRPGLLQDFLDRHTSLRDLKERETSVLPTLRENAARLAPLEVSNAQLPAKRKLLSEIEKKLKLAEEGNLREIVSTQSKLASEKAVRDSVDVIATNYSGGHSLASLQKDFPQILATAGECTSDAESASTLESMKDVIEATNAELKAKEGELRTLLKGHGQELRKLVSALRGSHQRMSANVAKKLADLKARGLATNIPGLEASLRQKTTVASEITSIEQRAEDLQEARDQREALLERLSDVRDQMTTRRKSQLARVNASLGTIIEDYLVFLRYDESGITGAFESFMQEAMHGTYLQDEAIAAVCSRTTPRGLATLVMSGQAEEMEQKLELGQGWGAKFIQQLSNWKLLYELQILAKPPKPIITVRTRSTPPRDVPVKQLSDGQRHTILLTIAMLADSNVPLVIDQPEDDLDNAFIFTSVVATLRAVKERRQVILVTHNPNIAVLGDSELILPMYRENDVGRAKSRGSIDSEPTRRCVVEILEGGTGAFLRRKEMYGH
jgi:DNA repair ATPase RecN